MPSKLLIQAMDGTPKQIVFGDHAGDFAPTAANDLRVTSDGTFETDVQMATAGLASGSYYQSAKADFGEHRAERYKLRFVVNFSVAPTADSTVDFYWSPSQSSTAGTGNAGGASGADGSYTGYGGTGAAQGVKQMDFIGSAPLAAVTGIQVIEVGVLLPTERYGSLVLRNGSGQAFNADDVEIHAVLDPQPPESQ